MGMNIELLSHTKDPELLVAMAAKLCYAGCTIQELKEKQTEEGIASFIDRLIEMNHESPLEHVSFSFGVEGMSRITEQQITRHRISSFSVQSGRYVNRKNAKFYKPKELSKYKVISDIYDENCESAKTAYNAMVFGLIHFYTDELCKSKGVFLGGGSSYNFAKEAYPLEFKKLEKKAAENARAIFPNSLETKMIFTMNLRSLLNFLEHRCCFRAQEEIRELAYTIKKMLTEKFPILFKNAGPKCLSGICYEGSMQCDEMHLIIPTMKDVTRLIHLHWQTGKGIV